MPRMRNTLSTVDLGDLNEDYNEVDWDHLGANESVDYVDSGISELDDMPALEPDPETAESEQRENLLSYQQLTSLFWGTSARTEMRNEFPFIRHGNGSASTNPMISGVEDRQTQRAPLATVNRSTEDISMARDRDEVTIVFESIRSSTSRRRRRETNLHVEIEGRASSFNEYVISPETAEREKLISEHWTNKSMPTVFKFNHPRNKCYVFLKDWLSNKARYSHKLALILKHATLESRVRSFEFFPSNVKVSTQDLAEAGFFYVGYGDVCKCFCCQGLVCNWLDSEDVWKSHAFYYPDCEFVALSKGGAYIRDVYFENRLPEFKKLKEAKKFGEDFELRKESVRINNCIVCAKDKGANNEERATLCPACVEKDRTAKVKDAKRAEVAKEEHLCVICLDAKLDVLLIPCAHIVMCKNCCLTVKTCPVCRTPIQVAMKVFFS